jgi:hypothetical protein
VRRLVARTAVAGLAVSLTVIGATASAAPALAASTTTWRVVHKVSASDSFTGMTATSSRHAWTILNRGAARSLLAWNGHRWQTVTSLPAGLVPAFLAASAPSNIWVFGLTSGAQGTSAVRWNGTSWQQDNLPAGVGYGSVAVVSASEVWYAYGSSIWRWNGSSWLSSPAESDVAVGAGSGGQVWQAGTATVDGRHSALVARRWTGTAWQRVRGPHPVVTGAPEVSVGSARDVWILLTERGSDPYRLLHWYGRGWQTIRVPAAVSTESENASVTAVGRDSAWFSATGLWTGRRWLAAEPALFNGGDASMTAVPGTSAALIAVAYRIWQNGKL